MLRPLSVDLVFAAFFVESKVGKTGLMVTLDVHRVTASGSTEVVTGGSATEVGDGVYRYTLSSSSTGTEGLYVAVFKTSTTSVDQQHIAAAYYVTDLLGNVNVTQISGDATAANNAESFFDGTGYAGTNNVIPTVTSVTNGVTLANGAITAAVIATDAIDGDALAASAVTEIQSGLATASSVSTLQTTATAIETDTQDIQSRLPAALVSGRMASDAVAISGSTTAADNVEANIGNLDAAVSSRLASAGYTAPDNASVTAIKAKTDSLTFTGSDVRATLDSETVTVGAMSANAITATAVQDGALTPAKFGSTVWNKIADHVLRRSAASAESSSDGDALAFRSLLGAVAKLVNRVSATSTTLTVYRTDDSTALGTQTVTTDASADPITELNTN